MKDNQVILSVLMLSYNHEKYIKKAIESVLNQKTKYQFEVIIHDDASQDRSSEIIREYADKYPNIIIPILQKENQYSKKVGIIRTFLNPIAKGKYITVLECDDYWIDDKKIDLQIDFLEKNPEFVACTHNCFTVNENDERIDIGKSLLMKCKEHSYKKVLFELGAFFPGPLGALVYRRTVMNFGSRSEENDYYKIKTQGDVKRSFFLSLHGDIYYFQKEMSVYRRVTSGGSSWSATQKGVNRNDSRFISSIQMRAFAKKYYNTYYLNYYATTNAGIRALFLYMKDPSTSNKKVIDNILDTYNFSMGTFILYLLILFLPSLVLFCVKEALRFFYKSN